MKAVQLLVNSVLPPDLRNYDQTYDDKSLNKILHAVATKHPEQFADIEKKLSDIGRKASYNQGETISLKDLASPIDKAPIFAAMDAEIAALPKNEEGYKKKLAIMQKYNELIEKETSKAALAQRNNIAMSVLSGARGKSAQLKAMVATPGTYSDYKGETVPVFSRESFAEGVRPAVFLASTNGSRSSVISTKNSTAKGGDLAKQFASTVSDLVIRKEDCGTDNGIELSADDSSLRGRELVHDVAGIKAGTFIGRNELDKIRKSGVDSVVVRSALTCSIPNGLCAHCVGKFYNGGKLPKIGDSIGLLASSTVGEPLCLVKGTLIRLADGTTKAIEDIVPGDIVLGSDLDGNCTPAKVVNVFHNGLRPCYRTNVRKGRAPTSEIVSLESTLAHKVLSCVKDADKKFNELTPVIRPIGEMPSENNVKLFVQMPTSISLPGKHEPMAMLLGMLIGDGSYTGKAKGSPGKGVGLSCYDDLQTEALRKSIEPLGLKVQEYTEPHEYRIAAKDQHDPANFIWYTDPETGKRRYIRNKVRAKLIEEGMWGQNSSNKTLPKTVWTWDDASICEFVGGLIATDGYVDKNGKVGYSSKSYELIKGVKNLMECRLGIYGSNISQSSKKKPDGTYYDPVYDFMIADNSSLKHLASIIHIPGRKDVLLNRYRSNSTPCKYRHGMFYAVSQEDIGEQDTWDIEIDNDTHLFVLANGMIVSNTQMALSSKHTAGMTAAKKGYSGLPVILQFTQSPEAYKDKGAVAEIDGKVTSIDEAPQGGTYVTVGDKKHYVLPGHELYVKSGDTVEAGDQLAEGLVDAEDIVRLKGLGDGKLYYAERLNQMLKDSGAGTDKRNTEILARGALRHVKITSPEGAGPYLPDDVIDYNAIQNSIRVQKDAKELSAKEAVGKYLQKPYLHYTIGTRVTPSMAKKLAKNSYNNVLVSDTAPGFEPTMVRLRAASHTNPDWLASMATSYLGKQLNESATRGDDTNIESNSDFRPRLAVGEDFGKNVGSTGNF